MIGDLMFSNVWTRTHTRATRTKWEVGEWKLTPLGVTGPNGELVTSGVCSVRIRL